ncbi:PAS domain S-box protein [Haloarcula laminariae]|uniref:PAS domain S-box protein n=1 Tax=Haloarcula laminariae TaxID=2961577 RepID=UPI0024064B9E|nr:PAS domain S-box protein [Halomicroarcula sp. FL173]
MNSDGDIRVLHVDDEPEFAEVAALHLERADDGLDVVTESSARDGLARLRTTPVDCVVSDHDMAGMNGLEFLRAVREEFEALPFILFTGKGNEEIASDAISAGVTEYLQKDVGTDQYTVLANRIRRAVGETRAKSALQESERQLSTLISNLPGMVYQARNEPGWPMAFVSDGAEDLVGYSAEAIESGEVVWGSLIDDEDADRIDPQVQRSISDGEPFEVTYRVTTADGERRWLWERGRVVGHDGDIELLEGFVTDITARKEHERELQREREFTETLVDTLDDLFYVISPNGKVLRWNDTASEVLGYSDEELSTLTAYDLVPETFHDRLDAAIEQSVRTGQASFEAPLVTSDGDLIRHEFRGSLIEDGSDAPLGVAGIARDITDRKQRDRELGRYETIVEAVGDPVYALDEDGVFTFVNEAIEPMTGYTTDELVGEHIGSIMTDEDLARGNQLIRDLLADPETDSGTLEMDVVTKWGERIPSENNLALLPSDDGCFTGTAGIIRDIQERKAREERLSEFASVVSHDLRNPLNVVQGRISLAQESGDVGHLDAAAGAADRMEKLIEDLLTLARQGDAVGTVERIDIATAAEEAWDSVDTVGATLELAGTATVDADPDRLRELLENLFRNAVEHGGYRQSPTYETISRRPLDQSALRELTVTVGTIPEDGDAITGFYVADDGPGIPAEDCEKVFERGFTTSTGGTGFGLAIVEDIATAHGWSVRATESDAGGARFEFTTSRADR